MAIEARLTRLEAMFPEPKGRLPAASLTDAQMLEVGGFWIAWCGAKLPDQPWTDEDREAIDTFWDSTAGLGQDFCVFGYSRYQLQLSLRHSAKDAGLQLVDGWKPMDSPSWADDMVDLGPYTRTAGTTYRTNLARQNSKKLPNTE
jgi:hypothetical protein